MNEQVRVLLVLWQHQASRRFVPVGRLTITTSDGGDQLFEFRYVRGLRRAEALGFAPFLAFSEVGRVYRSGALFPYFRNRVLQRSRPDYPEHVRTLGLVAPFDVVDVLGRSEGRRETDQIEVMPAPRHDVARDSYDVHFWVRGVRHVAGAEEAIATLSPGDRLAVAADPDNKVNPRALLLCTRTSSPIGYLPDYLVGDVHALFERLQEAVTIRVDRVNPAPVQPQRRALCHLQAPWPAGFEPLCTEDFQPLDVAPGAAAA